MSDPMELDEPVEPAPYKPPTPRPAPGPYKPSPLPGILTGLALGALLVGLGYGLSLTLEKKPEATAAAPTPSPTTPTDTKPAAPAPTDPPALLARVDGLATEVQGVTKRLDDLQKQVAEAPKPAPAPDLKSIEAKVDALAKRYESAPAPDTKAIEDQIAKATAGQSDALAKLSAQVSGLEKSLASDKGEIASLRDQIKSIASTKPASYAPTGTGTNAYVGPGANEGAYDADYAKAVDLFKKGQYGPARDAFGKLQKASPNDARVWYYGALCNGFATAAWNGETERMVTKGVELEKAGTPDASKINSAFAELTPDAKTWLDAYRSRAR